MKKLTEIERISFAGDFVLLQEIPINVGENIYEWLTDFCLIDYSSQKYIEKYPALEKFSFKDISGINIYTNKNIIDRVSVYPYLLNDSKHFQGDIYVFGKKIPKPFLSQEIENYFIDIKIDNTSRGYWERFKAHESIDYYLNDKAVIEILMNRDPKYVGGITLKINN